MKKKPSRKIEGCQHVLMGRGGKEGDVGGKRI
jgi:hypothetical protein